MKKIVIFDMDGVLIDTESIHDLSWKVTFEHFNLDISEENRRMFLGKGFKDYFKHLVKITSSDDQVHEMREYQRNFYYDYFRKNDIKVKPGVFEILSELKSLKLKLAVASATRKESAEKSLKSVKLYDYFDYHVFGDMVKESKPNPDIFLNVVDHFGFTVKDALVLEDSYYGIKAANNAKIDVFWIKDIIDISDFKDIHYNEGFVSMSEAHQKIISLVR